MTFRVPPALVVLALTALTMGVAFAIVWDRFVASQRDQLDTALLEVARREAQEAAAGSLDFTDAPGPSANAVGPLPKHGVIYAASGRALSTTPQYTTETAPPMPRLAVEEQGFDFEHDGVPLRGVVVLVPGTAMRVLLATPRDDLEDDARILARAMTVAFVVGCAWAALVAFVVASRLTREHSIVGSVARRVASGDTSARVAFRSPSSELAQLADDLNTMIERLVGLNTVQERFVAHAAHELRTPLTSLRIEIEHALRTAVDRSDYEAALRGALESARRLSAIAEDLLQLARIKGATVTSSVEVEEALRDAIADVSPVGRRKDVMIASDGEGGLVRGERSGLARIFRNVLENAVRFAPRSTRVRVQIERAGERVEVTISDEGPGIAPEDAERIFEPFVRATRTADHEGTGLGLTIARELARAYGGEIDVRTGTGGRFVIRFERAGEVRDAASARPALAPGQRTRTQAV